MTCIISQLRDHPAGHAIPSDNILGYNAISVLVWIGTLRLCMGSL
jgi:hypothetical protein